MYFNGEPLVWSLFEKFALIFTSVLIIGVVGGYFGLYLPRFGPLKKHLWLLLVLPLLFASCSEKQENYSAKEYCPYYSYQADTPVLYSFLVQTDNHSKGVPRYISGCIFIVSLHQIFLLLD